MSDELSKLRVAIDTLDETILANLNARAVLARQDVEAAAFDEELIAAPGDVRRAGQGAHLFAAGVEAAPAADGSVSGPF